MVRSSIKSVSNAFRFLARDSARRYRSRHSTTSDSCCHDQPLWQATMIAIAAVGIWLAMVSGCQPTPKTYAPPPKPRGQSIGTILKEPEIRVRIARNQPNIQVHGSTQLYVKATTRYGTIYRGEYVTTPVRISRLGTRFLMTTADGVELRWNAVELSIRSADDFPIQVDDKSYLGRIVLVAGSPSDDDSLAVTRFDVVNHLPIEQYLPGVIARELYAHWHPEAFKAQAIAARSYALDRRVLSKMRHFDLESTQADQAYIGQTTNPKAIDAVNQTRGQVLTYEYYILPAYYSSTCGGTGQDATVGVGEYRNLLPLKGRRHGGWCSDAPYYRWGPVTRGRQLLSDRFIAFAASRNHPMQTMNQLADIQVTQFNSVGRPTHFQITDTDGRAWTFTAETFRIACNYGTDPGATGLPRPPKDQQLKSSHVTVEIQGEKVLFTDGRGFGHGVGLCQYGAQSMATANNDAAAILRFYYPGAEIINIY